MIMATISLETLPCFNEDDVFERLVQHIAQRSSFMPHQIAGVTGCALNRSTGLLLLLLNRGVVKAHLLIYHNTHLHDPISIMVRGLFEGFPELPIECSECDQIITSEDELSYEFLFTKIDEIELTK